MTSLTNPPVPSGATVTPAIVSSGPFVLDGRRLRAFNGPGLGHVVQPATTAGRRSPTAAALPNFLFNGVGGSVLNASNQFVIGNVGDPNNTAGADEDYDGVDLENWFLALQSADGQVMIPSFHRPGILQFERDQSTGAVTADDWTNLSTSSVVPVSVSRSKILRRRAIDMGSGFPTDPRPDPSTGRITFDVDNDGDGVTDSVWLDLGYPVQRDPSGKLYKPMFAFMVLGLNGRLPLNTVGNLQGRAFLLLVELPVRQRDRRDGRHDHDHHSSTPRARTRTRSTSATRPTTTRRTSGMSPSEINPAYAFMHADPAGTGHDVPAGR